MSEAGLIQAKLFISQPSDASEEEADRVSDHVMRMSEPIVQRKCAACASGAPCPKCEEEKTQRKEASSDSSEVPSGLSSEILSQPGGGQPLPESTRAFFEPRFGQDFRAVRVHADADAAQAARSVKLALIPLARTSCSLLESTRLTRLMAEGCWPTSLHTWFSSA
jgi:hypothetical protein